MLLSLEELTGSIEEDDEVAATNKRRKPEKHGFMEANR